MGRDAGPEPTTSFRLDPSRFAMFSPEEELDLALVAIGESRIRHGRCRRTTYRQLSNRPDKHVIGMNLNIIQHPLGWPKTIVIRNNLLTFRTDRTLLYETDTEVGSSGSPRFQRRLAARRAASLGSPVSGAEGRSGQYPSGQRQRRCANQLDHALSARATATLPPNGKPPVRRERGERHDADTERMRTGPSTRSGRSPGTPPSVGVTT